MRKALLTLIVVGIAIGVPAASVASTHKTASAHFKGVVIARIRAQHELVVAGSTGHTRVLRVTSFPAVGSVVSVSTTVRVTNGTVGASRLRVVGHARHARFAAFLVRSVGGVQFFAVGHSLLAAHRTASTHVGARNHAPIRLRLVASAKAATLVAGQAAMVNVEITSGGTLDETQVTPMGEEPGSTTLTLLVTISAVTPATATAAGSVTLTVNGQALTITLPAGTVLPTGLAAGSTAELTLVLSSAGGATTSTTTTTTPTTTTTSTSTTTTTTPTTTTTTTTGPCVDQDNDFDDSGCGAMTPSRPCTDGDGDFDDSGCAAMTPSRPCTDGDGDFDDTGCAFSMANGVFGSFGGGGDDGSQSGQRGDD
jgi:hypothetical protein